MLKFGILSSFFLTTSKLCFSICNVMHFVTINFAITDILISRPL